MKTKKTGSVMYVTDGNGNWTKTVFAKQCRHKVMFADQCQGALGHNGDCWCFSGDGSYCHQTNNRKLKKFDIAGGTTPPGHKSYVHPIDKASEQYQSHSERTVVTSKRLIARLERGETNENESITQPVKFAEKKRRKH